MVNGYSLAPDLEDGILTDRGAYIADGKGLYLATSEVSQFGFVFPETFTLIIWIHPIGTDTHTLLKKGTFLELRLEPLLSEIKAIYNGQVGSIVNTDPAGNHYTDKWGFLSISHDTDSGKQTLKLFYNDNLGSINTFSLAFTDTSSQQFVLGSSLVVSPFKGFILELIIFTEILPDAEYYNNSLFSIGEGGCITIYDTECISTEINPFKNSDGVDCGSCPYSCYSSTACRTCDSSCNDFCLIDDDPSECIDMISLCDPGSFNPSYPRCEWPISCISNCAGCINSSECVFCELGYNLQPDLSCAMGCPSGYTNISQVCTPCHYDCSECLGMTSTDCTVCNDPNSGLSVSPGSCSCNSGFYPSLSEPLSCSACDSSCTECSGPSQNECSSCVDSSRVVENGTCVCMTGYFDAATSCEQCHSDCETCNGSLSSNCLTCSDPAKTLENGSCVCPAGYFLNSDLCVQCHSDCASCNDRLSSNCLTCSDPAKNLENGSCVCPAGYFLDSDLCVQCHSDCETCDGTEANDCFSCIDPLKFVQDESCVCREGYYPGESNNCVACHTDCETCNGALETECTSCIDSSNVFDQGSCVCEKGFYKDSSGSCQACSSECLSCETSPSECLESPNTDGSGENRVTCQKGYFLEDTCKLCPSGCASCTSLEECSECSDSNREIIEGACECKEGYCEYEEKCSECEAIPLETELTTEGMVGTGSLGGSLTLGFVSMLTLEDPMVIWTITNIAQIICYLAILDLPVSGPFYQFLTSYQTVVFFPNYFLNIYDDSYVPAEYKKFGYLNKEYRDANFIKNSGRYLELIMIVLAAYLMMYMMSLLLPRSPKESLRKITSCWVSSVLKIVLTVFLDLCIAGSVFIFGNSPQNDAISGQMCVLVTAMFLCTPFALLTFVLYKERIKDKDDSVTKYIGSLYSDLNLESCCSYFYEMFLSLRRLTYAGTLFFYRKNPLVVLISQSCFSIFMVVYIICGRIYETKIKLVTNLLSEILLLLTLAGLILIYFHGENPIIENVVMGANIFFIIAASISNLVASAIDMCRKKKKKRENATPVIRIRPYNHNELFSASQKEIVSSSRVDDNRLVYNVFGPSNSIILSNSNIDITSVTPERLIIDRKTISDNVIYIDNAP